MNEPKIHLAILDDHQIVIDGLKLLLRSDAELNIAAEANNAEEMLQQLKTKKIDIVLTDITIPHGMNGYEFSLKAKHEMPHIKILALSMNEDGGTITKMIEGAKVDGYISKTAGRLELLKAIKEISLGKKYFSNDALQQYEIHKHNKNENQDLNLTPRELEIIQCITKHYSNRQIADSLFISERTVETHRKNIYRKTQTKGEASLILFVQQNNILS